jgi:DNA damage-inducible protein 1
LRIGDEEIPFLSEKDIPKMKEEDIIDLEDKSTTSTTTSSSTSTTSSSTARATATTSTTSSSRQTTTTTSSSTSIAPQYPIQTGSANINPDNFPEETIRKLMELGFQRAEVIQALRICKGNAELAASYLFGSF